MTATMTGSEFKAFMKDRKFWPHARSGAPRVAFVGVSLSVDNHKVDPAAPSFDVDAIDDGARVLIAGGTVVRRAGSGDAENLGTGGEYAKRWKSGSDPLGDAALKGRGGPGRGQGRKPRYDEGPMVTVSIRMTERQREILKYLGGGGWVRDRLEEASALWADDDDR
ncbi:MULTISPECIES: hypothetical protein [unclassified Thioalkalivibrio]|uniref:hypothetical protein n=1 Tax=unclassified Thioalkalivibrio TaxID=2621013 RepID=UPI000380D14C|nr:MULTISPECIES: hypothetical protein [unclassified Thioalkalivibrio]